MNAGRQLDALIAEKVMGWEMKPAKFGPAQYLYQCWHQDNEPLMTIHMWNPSKDISDAWIVVEKLNLFREKIIFPENGQFSSYVQLWQSDKGIWVIGDWEDQLFILAEGESAPHAICLAALRVTGVKIWNQDVN